MGEDGLCQHFKWIALFHSQKLPFGGAYLISRGQQPWPTAQGFPSPQHGQHVPASRCTRQHHCQKKSLPSATAAPAEIWALSDCSSARQCPGLTEQLHGLAFLWKEDEVATFSEIFLDCIRVKQQNNSSWMCVTISFQASIYRHNRAKTPLQDTNVTDTPYFIRLEFQKMKEWSAYSWKYHWLKTTCKMEERLISFISFVLTAFKVEKNLGFIQKKYTLHNLLLPYISHKPSSRQENWIASCCHQEAQPVFTLYFPCFFRSEVACLKNMARKRIHSVLIRQKIWKNYSIYQIPNFC